MSPLPPDNPRLYAGPDRAGYILDRRLTVAQIASLLRRRNLRLAARGTSLEVVRA